MVKKIYWTDTAKASIEIIFNYYKEHVSLSIAKKIKDAIFEDVKIRKTHEIGVKEPLLVNFENEYRYFVSGNYKLVYFVKDKKVIISLVFDTRQNPQNLQSIIAPHS
ncbi:MAG: type II toxin-antitoxin system RelE/ParE family toxin [Bacteroidota bacterium]